MANTIIFPGYGNEDFDYRIWNNIENGATPNDYFYSAANKNFYFKSKGENLTNVRLDFWGLDKLYLFKTDNTIGQFKTI